MSRSQLWLLLVVSGLASGVPFRKDNLAKREIESVHFGNHQNKVPVNQGMADAQLLASYLGPQKRAQILKENGKQDEEHDDKEEEIEEKKKRLAPEEIDESDWGSQYPTYYNYYNNLLSQYKPIISPEDNLPYVPAFRKRRASPIASAKSHHKKKSLPSSVSKFLRRRRSAAYDMIDPVTLAETLKAAATEEALEQLEEDNDYYDRYEFKYPYYPGMVGYKPEEDEEPEELDESQDPYEMLYNLLYSPPSLSEEEHSSWLDMSPAHAMQIQRRSEIPKKRYSFPYIAMPGQKKKKRDQIDTPFWGKIDDKRTVAPRKRQQQADDLYALAQLLNEVRSPDDYPVHRRTVL